MKILCPMHSDTTPSMEVYSDGHGYCFVCNRSMILNGKVNLPKKKEEKPEDMQQSIDYIKTLPIKTIRGLDLYTNGRGYFILWPGEDYYKFRAFTNRPKYLAPRGHKPPLFKIRRGPEVEDKTILVEGEINALSLAYCANYQVVSPGAASNFNSSLEFECRGELIIWTDKDPAGIRALWEVYPRYPQVSFINSDKDANEVLLTEGVEGLHKRILNRSRGPTNE